MDLNFKRARHLQRNFWSKPLDQRRELCEQQDFGSNEERQQWMQQACDTQAEMEEHCDNPIDYFLPGTPLTDACVAEAANGTSVTPLVGDPAFE